MILHRTSCLQRTLTLLVIFFGGALRAEVALSGTTSEVERWVAAHRDPKTVTLRGTYHLELQPESYRVEGRVFSRGRNFDEVVKAGRERIAAVAHRVARLDGARWIAADDLQLPQGELAFSELKDLEFEEGFRIEVGTSAEIDAVLSALSGVDGVIVDSIEAQVELTPDAYRKGLGAAIAELNRNRQELETGLEVRLQLLRFHPPVKGSGDNARERYADEVFELSQFGLASSKSNYRRRSSDRETESRLVRAFSDREVVIEIAAEYAIIPKP